MSGSKGYRASDASNKSEGRDVMLSLKTVQRMLPLVQHIVEDLLLQQRSVDRLQPEADRLERQRRNLDWDARQRRYQLQDELASAERGVLHATEELSGLGVVLLDAEFGKVGFPTMVNNRQAYFAWQPGDEGVNRWQFTDETVSRPIPASWLKEITLSGQA